MKKTIVITTINKPNQNIKKFSRLCEKNNSNLIIIGDKKTPKNFRLTYGSYFNLKDQKKTNLNFSKICPLNTYARKNIGYLISIKDNNDVIIESDDDNYPKNNFFKNLKLEKKVNEINNLGWINIYKAFSISSDVIWPRGLPLNRIKMNPNLKPKKVIKKFYLQQGVCEGNPDVDAIYRILNKKINIKFKDNLSISLGKSLSPINSQNTIWFKKIFPLMYLPVTCTMRATDIWRGLITTIILLNDNLPILFFGTNMKQVRNIHNLIDDLKQEMPLYQDISNAYNILKNLKLKKGSKFYLENLFKSYTLLIDQKIFDKRELYYLKTWIKDIKLLHN